MADSPVTKAFELFFELWNGELSIEYIRKMLDADSSKTVERYIARINRASSDAVIERRGDRVRIARTRRTIDFFGGSYDENAVAASASTPLGGLLKRKGALPEKVLARIKPILDVGQGAYEDPALVLLFETLLSGRYFRYLYASDSGPREHRGVAIRLYLDPVQPYLVALDDEKKCLICLAITKISSIRPDGSLRMTIRDLEDLSNFCRRAWGKMIRHDRNAISRAEFIAQPSSPCIL